MFRKLTSKIKMVWIVLTSNSVHMVYQRNRGEEPESGAFGSGDLKDMVLIARAIKIMHEGFLNAINEMATQSGDLHALRELKDAIEIMQGDDGRN